jgi:phosphatidate cytidylyltransferase
MTGQRVVTALVLTPLVVAAILLLQTPYVAAIAAAMFLAGLWEWSRLVGIEGRVWRATYLMANIAVMTGLLWARALPLFSLVSLVGVAWWLLATLWLAFPDLGRDGGWWARTIKLVAGTLSIVPAWCALILLHFGDPALPHGDPNGPRWALLALVMVWAADTCAYFVGVRFGKRKLIPHISPGKTWMGLWGGLAGAVLVGVAGAPLVGVGNAQMAQMAELALLTAVASVVGDLFESLMKRHSGMKDSGTLIPGHGGVLDRIDSLLAALPVLWIAKGWLGLGMGT